MSAPQDKETRVWAAMIFPAHGVVMGALRRSQRLHWTQAAARAEAERWIAEMKLGPITWEVVDDRLEIGRNHKHYVMVGYALLPHGDPPCAEGDGEESLEAATKTPGRKIIEGLEDAVAHARGDLTRAKVTLVHAPARPKLTVVDGAEAIERDKGLKGDPNGGTEHRAVADIDEPAAAHEDDGTVARDTLRAGREAGPLGQCDERRDRDP